MVFNSDEKKNIVSGVLYNEFGQMTRVARANGTVTDYTYDIKGRLSNLRTVNSEGRELQDVVYDFKVDNSIARIANTPTIDTDGAYNSAIEYTYKYDGLNRLVNADATYKKASMPGSTDISLVNSFERGYRYAPNGNLMGKDIYNSDPDLHDIIETRDYTYGMNNHAATSIYTESSEAGGFTGLRFEMEYDEAGNMTLQRDNSPLNPPGGDFPRVKAMEYDSYNRIRKVTNPDEGNELIGEYWYDDQGFRVRKVAKRPLNPPEGDLEVRIIEVLYPSMYFGVEKHSTAEGVPIDGTTYSVNNIYLNGVAAPGPPCPPRH